MAERTQAEIDASITKRRRRALQRAEEENILGIGKRKPKVPAKTASGGGGKSKQARWTDEPKFNVPSPLTSRPKSASGATSMHFSYTPITKQLQPTLNGKPLAGHTAGSAAVLHAKYIERDGAAEVGAAHAGYIERPGAIENGEQHLETTPGTRSELLFTNIADDAFMREEYWRAVEREERSPKLNNLTFDTRANPEWWAAALQSPDAPAMLLHHLGHIGDDTDEQRQARRPAPLPVSAEQAGKILEWAAAQPGWSPFDTPIKFESGRGGRIQYRIVAELPHELDTAGRALIVRNFTDKLGARGLMYTAVVHAPDAHNDKRNFHLHLIMHDRPAKWLEDRGIWDFEHAETYVDKKRTTWVHYPLRQEKVAEIAQTFGKANKGGVVETLRREFAETTNDVLAASGATNRYDHRSYERMGIDRVPAEHLGPKAAALESAGVPTAVGTLNAIKIWTAAERQVDTNRTEAVRAANEHRAQVAKTITGDAERRAALAKQLAERTAMAVQAAELRRHLDLLELLEQKAKSRALKTRETCLTYLVDIEKKYRRPQHYSRQAAHSASPRPGATTPQ